MKSQTLERHGPVSVVRNWRHENEGGRLVVKSWLMVEHKKECDHSGDDESMRCECGLYNGFRFDTDCDCVVCWALCVKHEIALGEDAPPEALALLETWAARISSAAIAEAEGLIAEVG
jgi:hypothetical protein